jgi:acyl-CoA synthetase (NDP forming)
MAEEFRTRFEKYGIPAYETPERAARAMYALARYGSYLCTHYGTSEPERDEGEGKRNRP